MGKREHFYYFDYIRVFAMFCVVFMHSASAALRVNTSYLGGNWHLTNAITSLAFTAVPLFFMMSGYLLFTSSKTADVSYLLRKRLPKLLLPLIAYSAIAIVCIHCRGEGFTAVQFLKKLATVARDPVMVHFWFMYTLVEMYLVSPILYGGINALNRSGRIYLAAGIGLLLGGLTLCPLFPQSVQSYIPYKTMSELMFFNGHIFSFLLGWLLGQMKKKVPNTLLIVIAVLDFALITVMTYFETVDARTYAPVFQAQNRGFEILLASCIFLLCKQNLNRSFGRINKLISPLTALTFPIYLLHNIVLYVLYFDKSLPTEAGSVIALTLAVTVGCYVILKTVATIKPLCYVFTGLSFKTACGTCNWIYTARQIGSFVRKREKTSVSSEL